MKVMNLIVYLILIVGGLLILTPFIWMILTAVKPSNEVLLMPPKWIPSKIIWSNFLEAYNAAPFKKYFYIYNVWRVDYQYFSSICF
jgi:multiple sugar transport system permease protein